MWAVDYSANFDTRDSSACSLKQSNILIMINDIVCAQKIKLGMDKRPWFGIISWEKTVNFGRRRAAALSIFFSTF